MISEHTRQDTRSGRRCTCLSLHGFPPTVKCCWLLGAVLAVGCSRSGLNLAPVEGVVTIDGKPVADAGVFFTPTDPKLGPPAMGTTDAEGKFALSTANHEGAVIGDHRVAISKDEATAIPQRRGFPVYQMKHYVPPNFGDAETSGLTATVADDENHFEFNLKAK